MNTKTKTSTPVLIVCVPLEKWSGSERLKRRKSSLGQSENNGLPVELRADEYVCFNRVAGTLLSLIFIFKSSKNRNRRKVVCLAVQFAQLGTYEFAKTRGNSRNELAKLYKIISTQNLGENFERWIQKRGEC